jgi:glyoxylate reductase
MTPRVLVACALPELGLEDLRERYDVETRPPEATDRWLRARAPGAAAIVADPSIPVDGDLLDTAGPSLKVVANFGVGYDNIELEAVRARGLRATNTPGVLTSATAELAVTLMLAAGRRVAEADGMLRRERRLPADPKELLGRELIGATVGLVGFGRIGQRVGELLRGFDVRLLYNAQDEVATAYPAESCSLADLLSVADFVSLHVPLTDGTRHLIDAAALAMMKPGAILVNTSRGGVVDTVALADALRSRRLAAAGLDVFEHEPEVPDELCELPNTVLLPHVGSATPTTRGAMARLCAENVIAVIEGREPPSAVT